MILIKLFFKILALFLIGAMTLIQWIGVFLTGFSAVLFNLLAGVFFMLALATLVMGIATGTEVLQMFIVSFVIFIIPYIAEWIIMRIVDIRCTLQEFIKS